MARKPSPADLAELERLALFARDQRRKARERSRQARARKRDAGYRTLTLTVPNTVTDEVRTAAARIAEVKPGHAVLVITVQADRLEVITRSAMKIVSMTDEQYAEWPGSKPQSAG